MMARTTIMKTGPNEVTLGYHDPETYQTRVRVFWVPRTSRGTGYVREGKNHSGDDPQVCDGLFHTGNALECSPEGLIDMIRKEWAAYQRVKKAEMKALCEF